MAAWGLKLFALLGIFLSQSLGTHIRFLNFPKQVAPPITYRLQLDCFMEDKFKDATPAPLEKNLVGIKSITVWRNGVDKIAHVSKFKAAEKLVDGEDNLQVQGGVGGTLNVPGYLTLKWKSPTKDQVGSYSCEVIAEDEDAKEVTFTESVSVGHAEPGLDEVIAELVQQHDQMRLRPVPRTQKGRGTCGGSDTWQTGPSDSPHAQARFKSVQGKFDPPIYSADDINKEPIFTVGLTSLDALSPTRVEVNVRKVDYSGFEVECVTWGGATIKDVQFEWVALTPPANNNRYSYL